MDMRLSTIYNSLNLERKNMADAFISFLYHQQIEQDEDDETAKVVQSALNGGDLVGPFDSVEEMMRSLDA